MTENRSIGRGRAARIRRRRTAHFLAAAALASLVAAACDSHGTDPDVQTRRVALATRESGRARLVLQDLDGSSRERIHFDGIRDDIPGNFPQELLPVTDETILALSSVRWSPDGTKLAAVVTVAFDQSEVVVMDADGGNPRAASPNTQIILSSVAWSPDGSRLAYTMSTLPHALGVDLFVTDLVTNRVTRVTTGANLGLAGLQLGWAANGSSLYVSRVTGEGGAPLFERTSSISRIDVTTGAMTPVVADLAGEVFGIAAGGDFAILLRRTGRNGSDYLERVVRRGLPGGTESLLTEAEPFAFAALTAADSELLLTTPVGGADALSWRLLPSSGGTASPLRSIETQANSADVQPVH
jgi:Tol biopolymer transport system component